MYKKKNIFGFQAEKVGLCKNKCFSIRDVAFVHFYIK